MRLDVQTGHIEMCVRTGPEISPQNAVTILKLGASTIMDKNRVTNPDGLWADGFLTLTDESKARVILDEFLALRGKKSE
tara:strand:+ start:1139 stop:1375 length:237 start_codon:yes stop_codon:yes gene_type:complete